MILGVQRSGTTALFETLSTAAALTAHEEDADSAIYDDYFLRPEPEIRSVIQSAPGPVLLKPVRESERRNVDELFAEYAGYDLTILWLYRDPVNVLYSWERKGWIGPQVMLQNAYRWALRNQAMLEVWPNFRERLLPIRYEDLLADPMLVHELAHNLGLKVASGLHPDSNSGRRKMLPEVQTEIDRITGKTLTLLDQIRALLPGRKKTMPASNPCITNANEPGAPPRPPRWLSPLFRPRSPRQTTTQPPPPGPMPVVKTMVDQPDPFSLAFYRNPEGCFRDWREQGEIHYLPEQKMWLALSYHAVMAVLADNDRFVSLNDDWMGPPQSHEERAYRDALISEGAAELTMERMQAQIPVMEERACNLLAEFRHRGAWDAVEYIRELAPQLCCICLGIKPEYASQMRDMLEQTITLDDITPILCHDGLLRHMIAAKAWSMESLGRMVVGCTPLFYMTTLFLNNVIGQMCLQPDWLALARENIEQTPRLLKELMRLMPPLLTVSRRAICDVEIAGRAVAAGSLVMLGIGAANRDPARFSSPDELQLHRQEPDPILFESNASPMMQTGLPGLISSIVLRTLLAHPFTPARTAELQPANLCYYWSSFFYNRPTLTLRME
jgi:cytochrome P450